MKALPKLVVALALIVAVAYLLFKFIGIWDVVLPPTKEALTNSWDSFLGIIKTMFD